MQCRLPRRSSATPEPGPTVAATSQPISAPTRMRTAREHYRSNCIRPWPQSCQGPRFRVSSACTDPKAAARRPNLSRDADQNEPSPLAALTDNSSVASPGRLADRAGSCCLSGWPMEDARGDPTASTSPLTVPQRWSASIVVSPTGTGAATPRWKQDHRRPRLSRFLAGARCVDARGQTAEDLPTPTPAPVSRSWRRS